MYQPPRAAGNAFQSLHPWQVPWGKKCEIRLSAPQHKIRPEYLANRIFPSITADGCICPPLVILPSRHSPRPFCHGGGACFLAGIGHWKLVYSNQLDRQRGAHFFQDSLYQQFRLPPAISPIWNSSAPTPSISPTPPAYGPESPEATSGHSPTATACYP